MAGIGVKLRNIFGKKTLISNLYGFFFSMMITVAPMILIVATIVLMERVLDISTVGYAKRELFLSIILYIFIFSLLTAAPFNAVLSKYMADRIYEEQYDDIWPCFYVGLFCNVLFACVIGIPFAVRTYLVGNVDILYVFTGYCGYIALVLVFYTMLYLSICKDYQRISFFFFIGMAAAFLLSLLFVWGLGMEVTYAILLALACGFFLIAVLELALMKRYFKKNSGRYRQVFAYLLEYWKLMLTNFVYTLGMFVHNFVFWTTDMRMVVADSFVSAQPYDMATFFAMLTNISASVIFITRVEMHFHERYKAYSEAVIGGRGRDIASAKKRMFRQLWSELMYIVRIQFIVSVVLYLVCVVFLPQIGFSGMVMQIYPCLAAGYFIWFVLYAAMIFLYYFDDSNGSLITALSFFSGTLLGSIAATKLPVIWYGMGLVIGAFIGWIIAYRRLCWVEKNMDIHIFCRGNILTKRKAKMPDSRVFYRNSGR